MFYKWKQARQINETKIIEWRKEINQTKYFCFWSSKGFKSLKNFSLYIESSSVLCVTKTQLRQWWVEKFSKANNDKQKENKQNLN